VRPLPTLYRDDRLVIVDKPPGLLSVPDPGAAGRSVPEVLAGEGLRATSVHRLDREVSGALLLALDAEALSSLQDLFRERSVRKTYWALATGHPEPATGELSFPILETPGGARLLRMRDSVAARDGRHPIAARRAFHQSRSSSLIEVLERVRSSTVLTMTAQ